MISANIPNALRKAVYRRDGYRCALCDSTKYIQIHHCVPRGKGGTNSIQNLITLCSDCHAMAHGAAVVAWDDIDESAIAQAVIEYLADYYAPCWSPWVDDNHPWGVGG